MKFGVREICDVVFKAKSTVKIGNKLFKKGQPVLYIDTAKTSTTEGAATTVYATGGKGNTRLIAWEGEKTLTFTVEDALLSPMGFAILSGAGLLKGTDKEEVHVHTTATAFSDENVIDLTDALGKSEKICSTAPIFAVVAEADGSITGELVEPLVVSEDGKKLLGDVPAGTTVFVDFYVTKPSSSISELQIDAENFAGYYYVEASTLFRRQNDGVDMPAELTFPNVKIQSNFTFTMASTGDPSTFTFTMDAFPGYTYFNPTKKVLCAMQIVDDTEESETPDIVSVFPHKEVEDIEEATDGNDNGGKANVISESVLTIPAQGTDLLGKKVSDMISPETYVATNGAVMGTLKYVTGYTQFNASKPAEQEGYFFPLTLADGIGTKGTSKMTLMKNGIASPDETDMAYDPELLFRVAQGDKFSVFVDDEEVITLTFAGAKFTK